MTPFIKHKIGNGESTFLWYDNWLHLGPILPNFESRVLYDAALPANTLVSSIISYSCWIWPATVTIDLLELQSASNLLQLPNLPLCDTILWTPFTNGVFSISSAWNAIRYRGNPIDWHNILWFSKAIKRQAFIAWPIVQDRISTFNKLSAWGLTMNTTCLLCGHLQESRNHLFYSFTFTSNVWGKILRMCGLNRTPRTWANEFNWATHSLKGNSFCIVIKKLAWASTLYNIWKEGNARLHANSFMCKRHIISSITNDVRFKAASFIGIRDNYRNRQFCTNWGISYDILRL